MSDETRRKLADALRDFMPWPSVFVSWPVYRIRQLRWAMRIGACGGLGCVEESVVRGVTLPAPRFLYCHPSQGCAVCLRCWMLAAHPSSDRNVLWACSLVLALSWLLAMVSR